MVEPVRCATPGTEGDCACQPCDSASSTIQSASTPPPCPPMASTATQIGRSVVYRVGVVVGVPERSFMVLPMRHCEEPTAPAQSGRPDDRLRDEAIHNRA